MADSPLPHNQIADVAARSVPGGYEVWVGTASEGVAVLGFQSGIPGDADGDGVVGINDVLVVLANWGSCPGACPPACLGDVDEDCEVGIQDFLTVLANWS
jgi:hypothetical protein